MTATDKIISFFNRQYAFQSELMEKYQQLTIYRQ